MGAAIIANPDVFETWRHKNSRNVRICNNVQWVLPPKEWGWLRNRVAVHIKIIMKPSRCLLYRDHFNN